MSRHYVRHDVARLKPKVDVEDLVIWAYRDQCVHILIPTIEERMARGDVTVGPGDWSGVEAFAALGCFVDRSIKANHPVHEDAERVQSAISKMPGQAAALLRHHGRLATRPDWGESKYLHFSPVWKQNKAGERPPRRDRNGEPVRGSYEMIYRNWREPGSHRPIGCKVKPVHEPRYIEQLRRLYGLWWLALADLKLWFADHPLSARIVTGPKAPRAPWNADPNRKPAEK